VDSDGVREISRAICDVCHDLGCPSHGGKVLMAVEKALATGDAGHDLPQIGWFMLGKLRELAEECHHESGGSD